MHLIIKERKLITMPKLKMPRKSTFVDMTAMTDVAFLLLAFFILTTKFKAPEIIEVETPSSVSTQAAEAKNVVLITLDSDAKVYFSVSEENKSEKLSIINYVNEQKQLNLSDQQKAVFADGTSIIGVPFSSLNSYLGLSSDDRSSFSNYPGIPVDSANNELTMWIRASVDAFKGQNMNIMLKGDNKAKYPGFQGVIKALKENDQMKFQLITNQEGVPEGSEIWKKAQSELANKSGS